MIDFNQIRKKQRFTYQHFEGCLKHKLVFKRVITLGDEKVLVCKVQLGKMEWYKEVYLTKTDFQKGRAKVRN